MNLVFDTTAYSGLDKGSSSLLKLLDAATAVIMPVVVIAELQFGFKNGSKVHENSDRLEQFLSQDFVEIAYIDEATLAERFASLKLIAKQRGKVLSDHDIWISALCLAQSADLTTYDQDFRVFEPEFAALLHVLR